MKIESTARTLSGSGVIAGSSFGISTDDAAHIMGILRDSLYTDKPLALLREYGANAWDSHRQSGIPNRPISVHIPTYEDSNLRIRDYGAGLTPDQVFNVYAMYGASTKRGDNVAVGALGIGGKSAFCYSNDFNITSYCAGTKSVYVASLDESDKGVIQCIHTSPTTETGIEVSIPINTWDIGEFERKAKTLFRWFNPRPQINIQLEEVSASTYANGALVEDGSEWVAVMGCIPYRVDINQIKDFDEGFPGLISKFGGVLYFDIGDVSVSASREELKYDTKTKRAVLEKIMALVMETATDLVNQVKSGFSPLGPVTPWHCRIQARKLKRLFGDVIDDADTDPELWKIIEGDKDDVIGTCPGFRLLNRAGNVLMSVLLPVSERTVVYLRDGDKKRRLRGYDLDSHNYLFLLEPASKTQTLAQAQENFVAAVAAIGCAGIPLRNLSEVNYTYSARRNKKYDVRKGKTFVYNNNDWVETEDEGAVADDAVYVNLFAFAPVGDGGSYLRDRELARFFAKSLGETVPTVYGWRTKNKEQNLKRPGRCWNQYFDDLKSRFLATISIYSQGIAWLRAWEERGIWLKSTGTMVSSFSGTEFADSISEGEKAMRVLDEVPDVAIRFIKENIPSTPDPIHAIEVKYPMLGLTRAWTNLTNTISYNYHRSNKTDIDIYRSYFLEREVK